MKKIFAIITILFMASYIYSQEAVYVKGKGYEGYIFPKEHSIWGFPPEQNRYTPNLEDIALAEKILRDSIGTDYVKSNQQAYRKPPINNKTLKKYVRQYVGYVTEECEIIIHIYLNKGIETDKNKLSEEIIAIFGGGSNHWHIKINISTKELFDMQLNK
ncbi:MAG TPA: hypothetical protein PK979_01165 [Bacteroidales bacterium]|nr:hypothetical protein [Bacteroidales bacterium]